MTVQDGIKERTVKNAYIEKESYPDGTTSSEKYYDKDGKVVKEKAGGLYMDYTYDQSGNQAVAYNNGTEAGKADGRVTQDAEGEKHAAKAEYTMDTTGGTTSTTITDAKDHMSVEVKKRRGGSHTFHHRSR